MATARLNRTFSDPRSFWGLTACLTGAISLGKGMRLPNDWSATQAQVDYHFGIVKRGLFGEMLTGPLDLGNYHRFVLASFAILILFLGLVVLYSVRSGIGQRLGTVEIVAVFCSSYSLTYIAHLVGYFDLLLGVMTLIVLLIKDPNLRLVVAIPISIAALMVHELFLFYFVPVILLSFLLQALGNNDRSNLRPMLARITLLLVITIATTSWLALRPSLSPEQMQAMESRMQARSDFLIRHDFSPVMTRSAMDNFTIMKSALRGPGWRWANIVSLVIFSPTFVLLGILIHRVLRSNPAIPRPVPWLAVGAALSPLLMHLFGVDATRWYAWSVVLAYLVLLTVCQFTEGPPLTISAGFKHAATLVMLLNIGAGGLLMDGRRENVYPFITELRSLLHSHSSTR